ncbi:MAG TPA: hypothetical protein VGZ69_06735 [Candidatus Rhabdochlamydia sp.]|jgi:hypothetical protein|nr:hypothetical protein [Candidatus Rhabdochlamydia sp.]
MMPIYDLSCNDRVLNWLTRVDTQHDKATAEKVQAADSERAKQTLESNTIYNLFFSSPRPMFYTPPQPASRGWFSSGDTTTTTNTNSHNTTHIHNTTYVNHASVDSSDSEDESAKGPKDASKKKKTKEEKTDWKGIAAIGIVSTAVAGISIFVYARLSKAAEGARNYLENTKEIEIWARTSNSSDSKIQDIKKIAEVQLKIDQKAMEKITSSKYSILTFLVGTLAMTSGGITILTSVPALATAATTAVIAGGALMSIAVMHEAYNRGMHWSDEEDGEKEFAKVKKLIPNLITALSTTEQPPAYRPYNTQQGEESYSYSSGPSAPFEQTAPPPTYEASQAIYNQRANPSKIYPDLLGFTLTPTAPPYESTKL